MILKTCSWLEDGEQCGSLCEGSTDYCATHGHMLRKQKRMAKKVQIVQPVKKVSAKRAVQNAEFAKLKKEYLALYPMCEEADCPERSVDVHHQAGKEGDRLTDPNYFIALCRAHHIYYTENSKEAIEKGISISRTKTQMI